MFDIIFPFAARVHKTPHVRIWLVQQLLPGRLAPNVARKSTPVRGLFSNFGGGFA